LIWGEFITITTTVSDYIQVDVRAAELGCRCPTGIAILPEYFETAPDYTHLRQRSEAATVKTLFRTNGLLLDEFLPPSERVPYIQNNSFEWVGPTLFISSALMTENPLAVSAALGVLSNYLTDFFKGMSGEKKAKFNIVVEKKENRLYKKLSYEGSVEGFTALTDIIKDIANE
jgi:hypothetical protein